jgi:hypothetical protein
VTRHSDPPQIAYAQWLHACKQAGWHGTPVPEPVPVQDGLGRVTAAPVRARWSVPRFACAAMDGIAIRVGAIPPGVGEAGEADVRRLPAGSFVPVDTGDSCAPRATSLAARDQFDALELVDPRDPQNSLDPRFGFDEQHPAALPPEPEGAVI